jgi:hypothetical protein
MNALSADQNQNSFHISLQKFAFLDKNKFLRRCFINKEFNFKSEPDLPIYQSTYLPIYLSTTLPLFHFSTLPLYHSTTLPIYRPPGLDRCLPYRVAHRPGVGRVLVAVRDVKPGELAILDRAISVLPENQPVCLGCLCLLRSDTLNSVNCPDCKLPFCKAGCYKSEVHQEECR